MAYKTYFKQERMHGKALKIQNGAYFGKIRSGDWVKNGCDICKGGMSKSIYDFQRKERPQGTICSKCSKKEDIKSVRMGVLN